MHFRFNFFFRYFHPYRIHDKHFDYFRNNKHYKNCVIQLNEDFKVNKLIASDKNDFQADELFSVLMERENVMKLSTLQLKDVLHLMANAKIDSIKYEDTLKFVDEKCALSVNRHFYSTIY